MRVLGWTGPKAFTAALTECNSCVASIDDAADKLSQAYEASLQRGQMIGSAEEASDRGFPNTALLRQEWESYMMSLSSYLRRRTNLSTSVVIIGWRLRLPDDIRVGMSTVCSEYAVARASSTNEAKVRELASAAAELCARAQALGFHVSPVNTTVDEFTPEDMIESRLATQNHCLGICERSHV